MRVLKNGSNKGCSEFYYSIGWDLGDWFNEVHCTSFDHAIHEAVEMTAKEFGESVEAVSVCNDKGFQIVAIGDFWQCLEK